MIGTFTFYSCAPVHLCFNHPGDIEIGLMERNGGLEVEVVQARGLTMKPGSKGPPGNTLVYMLVNQNNQTTRCSKSKHTI